MRRDERCDEHGRAALHQSRARASPRRLRARLLVRLADPGPIHDGVRRAERRRRRPPRRGGDAQAGPGDRRNRAKRLAREVFRRHKLDEGLDVVVVPRREMLDALFTSLEADYRAALDITTPCLARLRAGLAAAALLVAIRAYKVIVSPYSAGGVPVHADVRRLRRRGGSAPTAPFAAPGSRRAVSPAAGRGAVTASIRSRSGSSYSWNAGSSSRFCCRSSFSTPIKPISRRHRRTTPAAGAKPARGRRQPRRQARVRHRRLRARPRRRPSPRPCRCSARRSRAKSPSRRTRCASSSPTAAPESLHWQLKNYRDTARRARRSGAVGAARRRAASVHAAGSTTPRKPRA